MVSGLLVGVAGSAGSEDAVTSQLRYGPPVKTLIGTAGPDQMLVVGSRGPSAVGGILGSGNYRCVQYAKGPVVVVRGQDLDQDVSGMGRRWGRRVALVRQRTALRGPGNRLAPWSPEAPQV